MLFRSGDVELRQAALWRLHGEFEVGVLADEAVWLAELDRRSGLATGPDPRARDADEPEDDQREEKLGEYAHDAIISTRVLTFRSSLPEAPVSSRG